MMADNLPARRVQGTVTHSITDAPPPRTQYIYVKDQDKGGGRPSPQSQKTLSWTGKPLSTVNVPRPLPKWIGNQRVVGYMWIIAMITIGFDEWHNNGILPRPARLWYTSVVYGILALVGVIEITVPVVNALAIGYTIMLIWQYYNRTGQFSK